jgi:hypothetical protein
MSLINLEHIQQHSDGLVLMQETDCESNICPVVGGCPGIGGKVQFSRVILSEGEYSLVRSP